MSNEISIEQLTAMITEQVTKQLTAEFEGKLSAALATLHTESEKKVDKFVLAGKEKFEMVSDVDGLGFNKKEKTLLLVSRNGQIATGTKSPRTTGQGSAHFKMGNSEAIMPTSGTGSTRGVIVEGDGDDDKTNTFRVVSRMNRQGFNILSDGTVSIGHMGKLHNSAVGVYQTDSEGNGIVVSSPSKEFEGTAFISDAGAAASRKWSHFSARSETGHIGYETEVARIDGEGNNFANGSFYSNYTGYAEMFEWSDGNARQDNRNGFTVALDRNGKLCIAGEGDIVIGVVVPGAGVIGNSQWNHWHNKFFTDTHGKKKTSKYDIVEWLETETGLLKSYFKSDLPENFSMPENAIEIQTDAEGNDLYKAPVNSAFDANMEYTGRQDRPAWTTVCLLGTVPVYKGQEVGSNWIKVKDINDELELMIIK